MAHSRPTKSPSRGDAPDVRDPRREPRRRKIARFIIAVAASAAADALWWLREPTHLSGHITVVGYPTWANYDYLPTFLAYRLVVYAFPLGALLVYSLLAWRGPLRRPPRARPPRDAEQDSAPRPSPAMPRAPAMVARLLLPALIVAAAASARPVHGNATITVVGLAAGLAYVAAVLAVAAVGARGRGRASAARRVEPKAAVAAVNGVAGGMASIFGLWFVSRHSVVVVHGHSSHYWPWLPTWLAALGMLAVLGWGAARLRRGRSPFDVERRLLTLIAGSVGVFLITSQLPGQLGGFQGFDDAQNLVGASLLSKGYFPWRDFMFIHGLWMDALRSTVGFSVFGDTRWGSAAGGTVLLFPIWCVLFYLFVAWFARNNRWFLIIIPLLLLSGLPVPYDPRFILVPATLVLLGEMLRRRHFIWSAAFMVALFAQAVLVPEMLFFALPALLVVVAADLTRRPPGASMWSGLRLSLWCAAIGGVLLIAWCAFLAWYHALGAWIDYFRIFVPGHDAEGAIPPTHLASLYWAEFTLTVALTVITFWWAAARVRGRWTWSPRDWVTVAAAGFVALYGEKALGRFDWPHVVEVFTAAWPLALIWSERALAVADQLVRTHVLPLLRTRVLRASGSGKRRGAGTIRNPATIAVTAMIVLVPPLAGVPSVLAAATAVPSREHAAADAPPTTPRLGYTAPGAVSPSLLHDLRVALNTYAGKNGPVFDMTNSLGYVYYLLDRRPANQFVHVSMAITPYSQHLLISELRRRPPPVVIFDSTTIGLASWDGIRSNIRHYDVSQYVLRHWTPVVRTHGVLLLLRDDLLAARPPVPEMTVPPVTSNLWFSDPACDWGDVPNFLPSPPSGAGLEIPVTAQGSRLVTSVNGWAVNKTAHRPARTMVIASGRKVLTTVRPRIQRSDVARAVGSYAARSGFSATVIAPANHPITVYALTSGVLRPVAGQRTALPQGTLTLPGGAHARVGAPILGHVDSITTARETVGTAHLPAGVALSDYALLRLHANRTLGPSTVTISDAANGSQSGDIIARALPSSGDTLGVRVGSCLQWHGYRSRVLYVFQSGGSPITRLQLSGVR